MTPSHALGAVALGAEVRTGRLSARSVLNDVLERLDRLGGPLNAFRVTLADRAGREAAAVDAIVAAGGDPGPLAGVPYGVKDLFDVEDLATAAGSKIGAQGPPAPADAVLVSRLRSAGAVLIGVQVMDEYAYGFTTENAHYGAVHNPHDLARSAGGSSGGSAAAVAAGLGAFALGSDTNGSIRVPSSFCGIFGLKPTFGRLPRTGTFPFVHDLDHLGALARSVQDLALVYDVLQGPDPGDPGCAQRAPEPISTTLGRPATALRVAVLGGWFQTMADAQARTAVAAAAAAFSTIDHVTLDQAEAARSAAFLITAASGANLHRANLKARPQDFDPAVRGRLLAGALLPAGDVLQAQRIRRRFYDEAMSVFARFDVLLAPATPCAATLLGQATITLNGEQQPTRASLGALTQPISAIGLPVVVVPIRLDGQAPIGVQIIAPPWREDLAFQAAAQLERSGLASAPIADPCA